MPDNPKTPTVETESKAQEILNFKEQFRGVLEDIAGLKERRIGQTSIIPGAVKNRHLEENIIDTIRVQDNAITTDKILDGAITNSKLSLTYTWIAPTLLNSWVNYGSVVDVVGYFKDVNGIVHLKGGVKNGTIAQPIFLLPSGYRPANGLFFSVYSYNGSTAVVSRVSIVGSGYVNCDIGANSHVSLDGITFLAEQ